MNNRVYHILEIFWFIIAVLALAAGIHQTINQGISKSWLFFLITIIGFAMFYMRRNLRKRHMK